jgi:DNA-binding NtrC family response regulator
MLWSADSREEDKTMHRGRGSLVESGKNIAARERDATNALIWQPSVFLSIIETIKNVAPRDCPAIIVGETGTGKEMVAYQIHVHSRRAENAFVPVDCAALTGELFESQLFGHVKGAFPAASSNALGAFRTAHNGTIFLDEIEELSPVLQRKLITVLRESRARPVGSTKSYPVNVRVICATSSDLRQMVRNAKFQSELYYRLNVVQLEVPPLRERKEDIIILARYFLDRQAQLYNGRQKTLSHAASKILATYSWPGNVRELANVMEQAYLMSDSDEILPSALPVDILTRDILPEREGTFPALEQVTKKLVVDALQATNGRKMAAAKLLRIDNRKLSRLIKKYKLQSTWK